MGNVPGKKVINSDAGDADHYGGNDIDDIQDYLNNVDKTGPVKINTRQYFRSGKLELRNPADTFSYVNVASAIAANRNVTEPLLTADDTRVYQSFAQTLSNKTLDDTCSGGGKRFDYSYFIYLESGTYKARNGKTGVVDYSNAAIHSVIQSILDAAATNAYVDICIEAGLHVITTKVTCTGKSNIRLRGEGKGVTILACNSSFALTELFQILGTESGTFNYTVGANIPEHTNIVDITLAQSANFVVGDYVRISSDELADTSRKMGEVHRVAAIDGGNGDITLDSYTAWGYIIANNARIVKQSLISNITIEDLSITDQRTTAADNKVMLDIHYAENVTIRNVDVYDAYNDGIYFQNVLNSEISSFTVSNIKVPTAGTTTQYGMQLAGGCKGITVTNCHGKGGYRHFIVTDGWGDAMPRNIVFDGCTSYGALYADFNTHDSGDNIKFTGCHAWGGKYNPAELLNQGGFEIRSRHTDLIGCSAFYCSGRAIHITNQASGSNIVGCTVIGTRKDIDTGLGDAISLEGSVKDVNIDSCYVDKSERKGIVLNGANDRCKISNCIIRNTVSASGGINIVDSANVTISNNKTGSNNRGLVLSGTTDNARITNNEFSDNTNTPTLSGVSNYYFGNTAITDSSVINRPDIVKYGTWYATGSGTNAEGLMNGRLTESVVGTGTKSSSADSTGIYVTFDTGATINSIYGHRHGTTSLERINNCYYKTALYLNSNANVRIFAGLIAASGAPASSADPLNAVAGVALWFDSGVSANWKRMHNDSSGASVVDDTSLVAATATLYPVEIFAVGDTKFVFNFNGVSTDISSDIPASTTNLGFYTQIENTTGASRTMRCYYEIIRNDK